VVHLFLNFPLFAMYRPPPRTVANAKELPEVLTALRLRGSGQSRAVPIWARVQSSPTQPQPQPISLQPAPAQGGRIFRSQREFRRGNRTELRYWSHRYVTFTESASFWISAQMALHAV